MSKPVPGTEVSRLLMRAMSILLSGVAVALIVFVLVGGPDPAREYKVRNEIARFTPTVGHGLLQFFGEAFLLVLIACVAYRWMRIRL